MSLYKINAIQRGRAKDKVIARCLVAVNVKDANPRTLFIKIKKNREMNIIILIFFVFSRIENSLFIE